MVAATCVQATTRRLAAHSISIIFLYYRFAFKLIVQVL